MTKKLLVRQGGGAASEVDFAAFAPRKGAAFLDQNTPLLQMGQRFANGEAAQGYFKVVDPEGELPEDGFRLRPWAEVRLTDDASGDELTLAWMRLSAGDVARSGPYVGGDEIEHSPQLMCSNIDLRGIPFVNQWHRDAETDQDRLEALQARKLNGSASTDAVFRDTTDITIAGFSAGHLCDFAVDTDLDARNYQAGTEVLDVIAEIAEQAGKIFGVVLHHDGGATHKCLLYIDQDNLSSWTSAVRISDDVADWDPDDNTAPTFEPHWVQDSGKEGNFEPVVSGLVGIYGGSDDDTHTVFVDTGEAQEDQEVFVGVYNDDKSETATQATRRANWQLTDRKRPFFSNRVSIIVRADQAHLVEAGQAIETKSVVFESGNLKDTFVWRRVAQKILEPLPDGRYWLHLQLERPRMTSGPNGGAGQPGATTPRPAPPCEPSDPGGIGDPVAGASLYCPTGTGITATGCGPVNGDLECAANSAEAWTGLTTITPGTYYTEVEVATKYGGVGPWVLRAEFRDSGNVNPIISEVVGSVSMGQCRSGTDWTTVGGTFEVPSGYDRVRFGFVGPGAKWFHEDTHILTEFTPPSEPTGNDPDCIPEGSGGDSPFYARSDDPRFDNPDQHPISRLSRTMTNGSGGDLLAGAVVIATDDQTFDTTSTATYSEDMVGTLLEDIADGEDGLVRWVGLGTSPVTITGTAAVGDYIFTSTTPGEADTDATRAEGAVGRVIAVDADDLPSWVEWWGTPDQASGGGSGAPTTADYLVGTAQGGLSAEIVVGTSPGGELGGTWASPTVDSTHSGSAHHTEDHNSRHENGGADELEVSDLGTSETDTDLRLRPDGSGGVEWGTAPAAGAGSGNVLAEPQSGSIFIPSLALGDRVPASPGTYDEEFDGTADTLPTNWSWTSAPSGSDAWFLNSRLPSLLNVEGTGNTTYTLTRTSFSAASTFGIWVKIGLGPTIAADQPYCRFYVFNSGSTEGRAIELRTAGVWQMQCRALKTVSSAESLWSTARTLGLGFLTAYLGITRDGSNQFQSWYSPDGIHWDRVGSLESHTITIDRFRFNFVTTTVLSRSSVDWVRYRTDNAFPRP